MCMFTSSLNRSVAILGQASSCRSVQRSNVGDTYEVWMYMVFRMSAALIWVVQAGQDRVRSNNRKRTQHKQSELLTLPSAALKFIQDHRPQGKLHVFV